jgi:hypothetical protein
MTAKKTTPAKLAQYKAEYDQLKETFLQLGYILQGSVTERYMECGKPSCSCRDDPARRHGPYYQWSRKIRAKTESTYLSAEQAKICGEWIQNHRQMEELMRRMQKISRRVAALLKIIGKPG